MTSRGEETKKKRNVLVRFEALEEFFKKNQLFCANLFYLTVFSVAKFHWSFSLDWKWQELVFIDLLSFAWNSFIYVKACPPYLFA